MGPVVLRRILFSEGHSYTQWTEVREDSDPGPSLVTGSVEMWKVAASSDLFVLL